MTTFNSFPITGRKTSEFAVGTSLPAAGSLIFWSGVPGENLDRIGLEDFVNEINKYLTSAAETLAANKEIGTSDTFVQILISGASPRTITVADNVSTFVHNSASSANVLTVEGTELAAGESCFVFWNGSTAHTVVKLAATSGEAGGTEFLTITQNDFTNASYYYYGGEDSEADWKINRYDKSTFAKTSATQANNGGYATLASAWPDRTTLTYA